MATTIFDSLPYYDNDLDVYPNLREKVDKELAREGKAPQTIHPKVPPPIELFNKNPLLAAEIARVESRQPLTPLDTTRHQLPGPTATPATDEDWQTALKNAYAQLEHQRIRQTNIALLQQYGANAWRVHNYLLEVDTTQVEKAVEDLHQLTTDVNRERKNLQTGLGAQLTSLETRWTEFISNVLQIEMANVALEAEIDRLTQKEAELTIV